MEQEIKEIRSDIREINESLKTLNGKVAANTRWRFVMIGGLGVVTVVVLPLLGIIISLIR